MDKPRIVRSADLDRLSYRDKIESKPKHSRAFVAQWYCEGEGCVVREVQIQCKLPYPEDAEPRDVICPACRQKLKFHGYVNTETVYPPDLE